MNYVLTGPESSGKTTLALELAKVLNGTYVPEYARKYMEHLDRPYVKNDLLVIAKEQFRIQEASKQSGANLIFDTDLLTIRIWSDEKYKECDSWILNKLKVNKDFVYVLCKPDFPWQPDPQRENPTDQMRLFELYEAELIKMEVRFVVATGSNSERVKMLTSF